MAAAVVTAADMAAHVSSLLVQQQTHSQVQQSPAQAVGQMGLQQSLLLWVQQRQQLWQPPVLLLRLLACRLLHRLLPPQGAAHMAAVTCRLQLSLWPPQHQKQHLLPTLQGSHLQH